MRIKMGQDGHTETVDSAEDVGGYTSLALDPTTRDPRISYLDWKNSDLKYAYKDGTGWHTNTVDSAGDVWYFNSLSLDPSTCYPRISYFDFTNSDLKYASLLPINQVPSITGVTVPSDPVPVNTGVSVSGTFTDQDTDDTHTAVWNWGDGTTSAGTVTETDGNVTWSHTYTAPGVYSVTLTVTDSSGASDTKDAQTYVVVYDPTAGSMKVYSWLFGARPPLIVP